MLHLYERMQCPLLDEEMKSFIFFEGQKSNMHQLTVTIHTLFLLSVLTCNCCLKIFRDGDFDVHPVVELKKKTKHECSKDQDRVIDGVEK